MYSIKISDEAELDLEDAYLWYENQVKQLGSEFIRVIDRSLTNIQKNPLACPLIYRNVRRKLLPRFPYFLLYFIDDNIIFIFACFHVKRDPKHWKRRL
jgi:toxin ParE1/3/4